MATNNKPSSNTVIDLLKDCTQYVRVVKLGESWSIGWSVEEYRRGKPIIDGPGDVLMTITSDGIEPFEGAVGSLLKEQQIASRWKEEDFWGMIAALTCRASTASNPLSILDNGIAKLRSSPKALTCFGLANVDWKGKPSWIDDIVVGNFGDDWIELVESRHHIPNSLHGLASARWIGLAELQAKALALVEARPLTVAAFWTVGQGMLSHDQAVEKFNSLIGLCLLLGRIPRRVAGHRADFTQQAGPVNRPGPRGLSVDREAITRHLRDSQGTDELGSPSYISSITNTGMSMHWYSADPFPLSDIVSDRQIKGEISSIMAERDPVSRRILVASRWYAAYYWSTEVDDGALALGVALDSLIGSKSGLPGRVMAERYGMLESDVMLRSERARRYSDLYEVRSSVAHGRRDRRLDERGFLPSMASDVRWVAARMMRMKKEFEPDSEKEIEKVFEDLKWGVLNWP
ncbi:hypothetical protein [Amycolatopsis sp. cmx-4-61]|uniref:hypothetical protein n=1 Tax=Amycolatopsis sp. cmx-4-61 TaxID=2790937 RepID=UPI00397D0F84